MELRGHSAGWYSLGPAVREYALAQPSTDDDLRASRVAASRWFEEHQEFEDALRCLSPMLDSHETADR